MVFQKIISEYGLWIVVALVTLGVLVTLLFALNLFGLRDWLANYLGLFRF